MNLKLKDAFSMRMIHARKLHAKDYVYDLRPGVHKDTSRFDYESGFKRGAILSRSEAIAQVLDLLPEDICAVLRKKLYEEDKGET